MLEPDLPILVTGATGLLGNNVVRCLQQNNEKVAVYIRKPPPTPVLDGIRAQRFLGDITSLVDLEKAMSKCSGVIHCAGNVHMGFSQAAEQHKTNVVGTRNVCALAHQFQIRMVHVSTVNALGVARAGEIATEEKNYGQAFAAPYVTTKIEADDVVREYVEKGLDALWVHPGFMLGPYDWKLSSGRMLKQVVDDFVPYAPAGAMSICDARDVAAGIVTAFRVGKTGRNYILAGYNMTYLHAWQMFSECFGKKGPSKLAPASLLKGAAWFGDMYGRLVGTEPDINSATIALGNQYHVFSSERAIKELGYQLRPLEQTVRDTYQWITKHHSGGAS